MEQLAPEHEPHSPYWGHSNTAAVTGCRMSTQHNVALRKLNDINIGCFCLNAILWFYTCIYWATAF